MASDLWPTEPGENACLFEVTLLVKLTGVWDRKWVEWTVLGGRGVGNLYK